ncbi:unnamed protein product [Heligmosomoides polygyrus]|uniref:DUF5641 domain-containing protein n=1 Tax=Heligmosomoides polygyrus TaxID=6339 RepID=A0A3P8F7B3_HELPZ|nr:unnamed protein product [Heligmosomoides polygyrus]
MYVVLLRFRLPTYVITSDVEKAFLQVRLPEADRDATRFLWVKDLNAPVDDDNIAIFRFTRVTFGLNVSPYLLGATIQYHLRFAVQDRALASEIQENLYVDNLVLLADTKEEALQKAKTARTIFEEMGMNLREFLSNDSTLCANLPKEACARSTTQKVLGVQCHHSSLRSAKRATALVLRFIKKLLRATEDVTRRKRRCNEICPYPQSSAYSTGSQWRTPYEDEQYEDGHQVWRSRGRIGNSALDSDTISPIFIARNTAFARLIIQEAHGNFHKGIEHTMASVREHYWIPKLRQQVRKFVTNCVKCRRFNGIPYHYPSTSDLPQRRVLRSRPFQHICLGFFDLPSCTENGEKVKLYGCIFTCAVTRLVHLEVVRSMSTDEFLNAPGAFRQDAGSTRRNYLVRPTRNCGQRDFLEPCNTICALAGGFYETLIKSVKHSLYMALRSERQRSFDEIHTFVVEASYIPGLITGRAKLHSAYRFVQREMKLTLQLKNIVDDDNKDGPSYLPPNEARALQCRQQVVQALRSSCQETEKFWNLWQQHYLTSLRDHRKITPRNRLSQCTPAVGDVVLISDPVLPRNGWKLARITATRGNADGKIREAELVTATRRKIRRPVNLLIPLEVQDSSEGKDQEAMEAHQDRDAPLSSDASDVHAHRYNLRPRQERNYCYNAIGSLHNNAQRTTSPKWFLFHIMLLSLFHLAVSNSMTANLTCADNGVFVHLPQYEEFEICAEQQCRIQHSTSFHFSSNFHLKRLFMITM